MSGHNIVHQALLVASHMHPPQHTLTQLKPTTEGAQMCRWPKAEVGLVFSSDSSHMAHGNSSKI